MRTSLKFNSKKHLLLLNQKWRISLSICIMLIINALFARKLWLSLANSHVVITSAANASSGLSNQRLLVLFAERSQELISKSLSISNSKNSYNKLTPMNTTSWKPSSFNQICLMMTSLVFNSWSVIDTSLSRTHRKQIQPIVSTNTDGLFSLSLLTQNSRSSPTNWLIRLSSCYTRLSDLQRELSRSMLTSQLSTQQSDGELSMSQSLFSGRSLLDLFQPLVSMSSHSMEMVNGEP